MIFTNEFVRELDKIERRHGVRISGVIVTGKTAVRPMSGKPLSFQPG